ncbi:MAG TPA: hypothetical protein VNW15_00470 [Rhizomicrobium sp.]|jgi:hypothetical protein|nr:hypothetical protein [Rhizomicrobium sp.]
MAEALRTYQFKHYRRTAPGGTTGELLRSAEIQAAGLAYAGQIADRDYLPGVNFESDFVILEGENFIRCYLAKDTYA